MGLSLRLLFALAFALWVLPKIVDLMGGPDSLNPTNLWERNEQIGQRAEDRLARDSARLVGSLDDISVSDAGLRRCIKQELTRMYGSKLKHANEVKSLLCDRMGIRSLHGIDQFPNLSSLSVRDNSISSISTLLSLGKLKSLDLSGNAEIGDFTDLTQLASLEHVSISKLSNIYCHEVEQVFEHIASNKTMFGRSANDQMRSIQCKGKETRDIKYLKAKKQRGDRLSVDESRRLSDDETDQRWR